jgi:polyferredoxin
MGIDIRDGQQLECITCALCIDACDDVMTRLGKDRGLISYATLNDYNQNMALATGGTGTIEPGRIRNAAGKLIDKVKHTDWRSVIRPRTLVYFVGWGAIGLAMLTVLALRTPLQVNVLHDRNPLYVTLKDGTVRNGYDVKILNMTPQPRVVAITLEGLPGGAMALADSRGQTSQAISVELEPDKVLPLRLYVHADPAELAAAKTGFRIAVQSIDGLHATADVNFEAPGK